MTGIYGRAGPPGARRGRAVHQRPAHQKVLRGRALHLLALRGSLTLDGDPEDCIALEQGLTIGLASGVELFVEAVDVPEDVLGVELDGETWELSAPLYSVLEGPPAELVPEQRPEAIARLWSTGEDWMLAVGDARALRLRPDQAHAMGASVLHTRLVPVGGLDTTVTVGPERGGLTVVGRTDTAHVLRPPREPVILNGLKARLVTELGLLASPTPWSTLAELLWPNVDSHAQRRRLDKLVAKVRCQLREHGVREDLVHASGTGSFELFLRLGDRFVDEA